MNINKPNSTQQPQQQPLSLSQALRYLPTLVDLGLSVRSMPNSRQDDPKQQRDFLLSILEKAIELSNDIDSHFSKESSLDNDDGEQEQEENIRNQNWNQ
jgi:predicted transposase YbfD/YdcC